MINFTKESSLHAFVQPEEKDDKFICSYDNNGNLSYHNHFSDAMKIGIITFIRRSIDAIIYFFTLGFKGGYFAYGEKEEDIYDLDRMEKNPHFILRCLCTLLNILVTLLTFFLVKNFFTFGKRAYSEDKFLNNEENIQNIGHATQLITLKSGTETFRTLTDPVFYNLNLIAYRAATDAALEIQNLPQIDAIVISHNHRDHLCERSIKELVVKFPNIIIIAPKGDQQLIKTWCPKATVTETEWGDKVLVQKNNQEIEIIATPANHWCNRGLFDIQKSYTNGYILQNSLQTIYFAGDTAVLTQEHNQQIAKVIGYKPAQYLMPGGPNYPRDLMKGTHMSIVESFLEYCNLIFNKSKIHQKDFKTLLAESPMIVMHHNKWQLGPDIFNESFYIIKKFNNIFNDSANEISDLESARCKIIALMEKEKIKWKWLGIAKNDTELYETFLMLITLFKQANLSLADLQNALAAIKFPKIGESLTIESQKSGLVL